MPAPPTAAAQVIVSQSVATMLARTRRRAQRQIRFYDTAITAATMLRVPTAGLRARRELAAQVAAIAGLEEQPAGAIAAAAVAGRHFAAHEPPPGELAH